MVRKGSKDGPTGLGSNMQATHPQHGNTDIPPTIIFFLTCTCNLLSEISAIVCHSRRCHVGRAGGRVGTSGASRNAALVELDAMRSQKTMTRWRLVD